MSHRSRCRLTDTSGKRLSDLPIDDDIDVKVEIQTMLTWLTVEGRSGTGSVCGQDRAG